MKHVILLFLFFLNVFPLHKVFANADNWCIEVSSKENYNGVTLANGRIGLVSGADLFAVSEIVLNGVFDKEYAGGVSRMVRAPKFTDLQLKIDGMTVTPENTTGWKQLLNMKEAYLKTSVDYQGTQIAYTLRALRNLPYMALGVVEITPDKDLNIEVINRTGFSQELQHTSSHFKLMRDAEARMPVLVAEASSLTGMQKLVTCSGFLFDGDNPNT